MNIGEVRHLDEIKGNFGVRDSTYYRGSAENPMHPPHRPYLYRIRDAHSLNNKNTFLICYGRRNNPGKTENQRD